MKAKGIGFFNVIYLAKQVNTNIQKKRSCALKGSSDHNLSGKKLKLRHQDLLPKCPKMKAKSSISTMHFPNLITFNEKCILDLEELIWKALKTDKKSGREHSKAQVRESQRKSK